MSTATNLQEIMFGGKPINGRNVIKLLQQITAKLDADGGVTDTTYQSLMEAVELDPK